MSRNMAQRLERELHDKDAMYCNAIRDDEQQRNTMESELESFRKSTEDVFRKSADATKENSALKDKVQRQEKYIERLQNREKQNRHTTSTTGTTTATLSNGKRTTVSRMARPSSTARSSTPTRSLPVPNGKEHAMTMGDIHNGGTSDVYYAMDENERPNVGRLGGMGA
mmetsp:Transcript_18562/g.40168  ORF Transcript_18562/g.40168 Transcript_18562/m.40168 type:complete len:168 (+) Transcript_18562:2439-2942(+)